MSQHAHQLGAKVAPSGCHGGQIALPDLINAAAKVKTHVADALRQGARLLCGGDWHKRGGLFFHPTVLGDVTPRCSSRVRKPSA
jgi:succinate-semialdehyde dehydrogenase/glutarate-semialdehyde dehydrogenase